MSLRSSSALLSRAKKDLDRAWGRARTEWRDDPSREFEQKYLARIDAIVRNAHNGMATMDQMITQARRDCE